MKPARERASPTRTRNHHLPRTDDLGDHNRQNLLHRQTTLDEAQRAPGHGRRGGQLDRMIYSTRRRLQEDKIAIVWASRTTGTGRPVPDGCRTCAPSSPYARAVAPLFANGLKATVRRGRATSRGLIGLTRQCSQGLYHATPIKLRSLLERTSGNTSRRSSMSQQSETQQHHSDRRHRGFNGLTRMQAGPRRRRRTGASSWPFGSAMVLLYIPYNKCRFTADETGDKSTCHIPPDGSFTTLTAT